MKKFSIKNLSAIFLKGIAAASFLFVFSTQTYAYDRTEVRIGVVGENNEYWQPIIDKLL